MRKTLFLFVVVLPLFLGCGSEADLRGRGEQGGLSNTEYNRLLEINTVQNEMIEAREAVYANSLAPMASDKVSKLSKLMVDNCYGSGLIPKDEMSGSTNQHTIAGERCPVYWYRNRTYVPGTRTFSYSDQFIAHTPEFINLSGLHVRRISGNFSVKNEGAGKKISGLLTISEFEVQGHGKISGAISVQASYPTSDRGTGSVTLVLNGGGRWQHSASIHWDVRNLIPEYYIGTRQVEYKTFEELFSAFELRKIMENSLKMR